MDAQKHTVLLVEDEEAMALPLSETLKRAGYEVYMAGDGQAGLKLALEKHPDIILTDLRMPRMDGMEMIREIRKDAWGKNAEVIILTNVSDVTTLGEAMSEGTYFYMIKSDSSMQDILEKVKSRLKIAA